MKVLIAGMGLIGGSFALALRDRGIILRDQSRQPTLENCIRITVGTKDENERLLTELEEILKEAA